MYIQRKTVKKRKAKTSIQKEKEKLWELCKQITRKRYGGTCYTCGKANLVGGDFHTGHFLPSSTCGAYLRHDLRNLRPQCFHCNINLGGSGAHFYHKLVSIEGQQYVDDLFKDKQRVVKADIHFYKALVDNYTTLLNDML